MSKHTWKQAELYRFVTEYFYANRVVGSNPPKFIDLRSSEISRIMYNLYWKSLGEDDPVEMGRLAVISESILKPQAPRPYWATDIFCDEEQNQVVLPVSVHTINEAGNRIPPEFRNAITIHTHVFPAMPCSPPDIFGLVNFDVYEGEPCAIVLAGSKNYLLLKTVHVDADWYTAYEWTDLMKDQMAFISLVMIGHFYPEKVDDFDEVSLHQMREEFGIEAVNLVYEPLLAQVCRNLGIVMYVDSLGDFMFELQI